jgi:hypothetical protein
MAWLAMLPAGALAGIDESTQRWTPGIGDPTTAGWITVFLYAGVAMQCALNARRIRAVRREQVFWVALTVVLLLLSVNKQLDLQSWLTQAGRDLFRQQGWYETRRLAQAAVAVGLLHRQLRHQWRAYWPVVAGIAALLFFIIVRATTIHHVDALLHMDIMRMRVNNVLEIGALALVCAGAFRWRRVRSPAGAAAQA